MSAPAHTLSKAERLSGKTSVSRLLSGGRWGVSGPLKYCILTDNGQEVDRILVSVPKRLFKRAVKRNLLKRRLRESYRLSKHLLAGRDAAAGRCDIMLQYNTPDILPYSEIASAVESVLNTAVSCGAR